MLNKITDWAKGHCFDKCREAQVGGTGEASTGFGMLAKHLVGVAKKKLGLDKCRYHFTGAAPITKDTLQYFGNLDISICELYGMSENCGPQSVCLPWQYKWSCCGASLPGMEVKIDHMADEAMKNGGSVEDREGRLRNDPEGEGEICFRGRHIMMGYMGDFGKTCDAIDEDGWLHSGDLGKLDGGMIKITGRIKELIIGGGGENIAPVPIEDKIKGQCPALANVMLIGDKQKYVIVSLSSSLFALN